MGQVIEARIFAVNSHGRSDAVSLRLAQQKLSPDQLSIETGHYSYWFSPAVLPWVGGLVAGIASLLALVILVSVLCSRRNSSASSVRNNEDKSAAVIDADFFVARRRWSETSTSTSP